MITIHCLRRPDGSITSDPLMMRTAVDFYSKLFAKEDIDLNTTCELFKDLPNLKEDERLFLESNITFEEITDAVKQLSTSRAPGLDGLTVEFFKMFLGNYWTGLI